MLVVVLVVACRCLDFWEFLVERKQSSSGATDTVQTALESDRAKEYLGRTTMTNSGHLDRFTRSVTLAPKASCPVNHALLKFYRQRSLCIHGIPTSTTTIRMVSVGPYHRREIMRNM